MRSDEEELESGGGRREGEESEKEGSWEGSSSCERGQRMDRRWLRWTDWSFCRLARAGVSGGGVGVVGACGWMDGGWVCVGMGE